MAAKHTGSFSLNQWQPTDPVLMADFNADNLKIENALAALSRSINVAGNVRVERSSYTGSGGSSVSLTFSSRPLLVLVMDFHTFLIPGLTDNGAILGSSQLPLNQFQWEGSTVRWSTAGDHPERWNNQKGREYQYLALYSTI